MSASRQDPVRRLADLVGSPVLSGVIGLAGVVVPVVAWINERASMKNALLIAETVLVLALTANHLWLRRRFLTLRRATNLKAMDDAAYYDLVRAQLESELISDYGEIADGHLRVYASEVPRLSVMLVKTLNGSETLPKRILAADLTTNPQLLTQRREYLAANRRLIQAGGSIDRLFICFRDDLVREDYARPLLELINHHRQLGVVCGLAVRDRLRADQAVDFVIIASAAVLVEEEQGDADYTRGRSSVYFKGVERWVGRFESMWGHGIDSAPMLLQGYEALARPMLDADNWDGDRAAHGVDAL
ncbi:hypothetical protein GCM10012285_24140 [Streptomyces kronopolitis]|uniref:Uncharacterized protein n=1 Tax=Streptomyces kronopolitis TaxID=1612435 RepID=A0ABQ2JE60_9ACTN|nr:hypothetical protein [Streptomyces kronopolitis]GGN43116.1 hypothetical protein GCM10012285_24140 [Streptomyces kronopolitis]